MTISNVLDLSLAAQNDLRQIAAYTQRTWGQVQKQTYMTGLKQAIRNLRDHPHIGTQRNDISADLLAFPTANHIFFYRVNSNDNLTIIRILHKSMDVALHIPQTNP